MKRAASNTLTVIFLLLFVWYGQQNKELFGVFYDVSLVSIILLGILKSFYHLANGLFTKWTAETFTKRKLTTGEGYYVGVLTAIGNFFGPLLGGTSIRAVYLKKVHALSYSKFTATLFGYYLILFITNFVAGILSLLALPNTKQTLPLIIFFVLVATTLCGLAFIRLPKREKLKRLTGSKIINKLVDILYEIQSGWTSIFNNKRLLIRLFMLAGASYLVTVIITLIEFNALNISISLAGVSFYSVLLTITLLISITPGAIGIREALLITFSSTINVTNEQILQVALLDRAVVFSLLLVMFLATRSKRFKKFFTKKDIEL